MPDARPTALDACDQPGRPQLLAGATLWLLARYARDGGCERLHHAIRQHLALLAEHAGAEPVLRETCALLLDEWDREAAPSPRADAQPRSGLLDRLGRMLQ